MEVAHDALADAEVVVRLIRARFQDTALPTAAA